jgi:hypothetical protein
MKALTPKTRFHRGVALSILTRPESRAAGSDSFNQAIWAAIDTVDPGTLQPVAPRDAGAAFQPRALLASIVCCYARQIYGSSEIEAVLARNMDTRPPGLNAWPDAHMIREFRRNNRKAIQLCLITALCLLGQQKVQDGIVTKVSDTHFTDEASRRIIMAMFTDSMDLGAG